MMLALAGCSGSRKTVIIDIGEVGKLNSLAMMERQEGLTGIEQLNDTVTVTVKKDGTYYFYATDDSGKEVEIILTVQNGDVSVKTEDGADVTHTVK